MTDEFIQNAFKGVFLLQCEIVDALEWIVRDGAAEDDLAKARPSIERARAIIEGTMAVARKYDAEHVKP